MSFFSVITICIVLLLFVGDVALMMQSQQFRAPIEYRQSQVPCPANPNLDQYTPVAEQYLQDAKDEMMKDAFNVVRYIRWFSSSKDQFVTTSEMVLRQKMHILGVRLQSTFECNDWVTLIDKNSRVIFQEIAIMIERIREIPGVTIPVVNDSLLRFVRAYVATSRDPESIINSLGVVEMIVRELPYETFVLGEDIPLAAHYARYLSDSIKMVEGSVSYVELYNYLVRVNEFWLLVHDRPNLHYLEAVEYMYAILRATAICPGKTLLPTKQDLYSMEKLMQQIVDSVAQSLDFHYLWGQKAKDLHGLILTSKNNSILQAMAVPLIENRITEYDSQITIFLNSLHSIAGNCPALSQAVAAAASESPTRQSKIDRTFRYNHLFPAVMTCAVSTARDYESYDGMLKDTFKNASFGYMKFTFHVDIDSVEDLGRFVEMGGLEAFKALLSITQNGVINELIDFIEGLYSLGDARVKLGIDKENIVQKTIPFIVIARKVKWASPAVKLSLKHILATYYSKQFDPFYDAESGEQ